MLQFGDEAKRAAHAALEAAGERGVTGVELVEMGLYPAALGFGQWSTPQPGIVRTREGSSYRYRLRGY